MIKYLTFLLFITIFMSCGKEYIIKNDSVYMKGWNEGVGSYERLLKNADSKSFSVIETDDNLYGKDKLYVYYENEIIPGADPDTFKYIQEGYAVDKNRAYFYNDSIENSNSKEFEVIDYYFSKNYQNVFYKTKPLNVCSVNNFTFVFPNEDDFWGRWSTDGRFYFFNNYKVPSNDYKNITVYEGSHGISSDNKYVYQYNKNYFEGNERNVFIKEKGLLIKDTIDIKTITNENNILKDKFGKIYNNVYGNKTKF